MGKVQIPVGRLSSLGPVKTFSLPGSLPVCYCSESFSPIPASSLACRSVCMETWTYSYIRAYILWHTNSYIISIIECVALTKQQILKWGSTRNLRLELFNKPMLERKVYSACICDRRINAPGHVCSGIRIFDDVYIFTAVDI